MKPSAPLKILHQVPILFEDKSLLVVNKPAGMPSQSDQDGTPGVIENIRKAFPQAALIHRLDRPVGGLLVVAKNSKTAAKLSAALRDDQFSKDYLAVLWGKPAKACDTLEHDLLRDGSANRSSVVTDTSHQKGHPQVKKSVLHYETLASTTLPHDALYGSKWQVASPFADLFSDPPAPTASADSEAPKAPEAPVLTLVRIELETGRHHQIRVQMAHMGCPVLGDRKYGADHLGQLEPQYRPDMPALFSYKLSFKHPVSGDQKTFWSLPESGYPFNCFDLAALLE